MTLVASFTRTYREAQTYLTTVLLVPTLPIAFASIYSLKTKSSLMIIPSLSQHLLMTSVLKDESILLRDVLVSAAASLGLAAADVRAHRAPLAARNHARLIVGLYERLITDRRAIGAQIRGIPV